MQQITVSANWYGWKTDSLYVRMASIPTKGLFSTSCKSEILKQLIMFVNL